MALDKGTVEHIALLARVGMTAADIEKFQAQLSVILEHFEALRAVDTEGIPPTAQSLTLANVERDDEPRPSCPRDSILANTPQTDSGFVRVRRVLE